jgi:hypothetical protein
MAFLKRLFHPLTGRGKSKQAPSSPPAYSASLQTDDEIDETYDRIDVPEIRRAYDAPSQRRLEQPSSSSRTVYPRPNKSQLRPILFHCQLAHGGPVGIISGFRNIRDLYRKIAECYDIKPSEVRTAHNVNYCLPVAFSRAIAGFLISPN